MNLLKNIPDSWIKATVNKYCEVRLGKMLQTEPSSEKDELKPYLRAVNIAKAGLDLAHEFSMWITPAELERFRLLKGDILVSEGGDAGRTAVFDSENEYYFQNAINRIRPDSSNRVIPKFIYYWFIFLKVAGYVEMVCNVATIPHFTAEKVKASPLVLPPIEIQQRIAQFLDERIERIDELIEKKRVLLERLAEKRQVLITRAVTKGLNPAIPLKPSGIDWLGDIPAHWDVSPLRRLLRSSTYGISASLEPIGEIAVLRMGNLVDGEINFGDLRFLDEIDESLLLDTEDVVFNRTNSLDLVGKASIFRGNVDFPVSLASYLVRFRFTDEYAPEYANFVMGTEGLLSLARTLALPSIGQANLNPSRYALIEFPIPPVREQSQIVRYLVEETRRIQAIRDRVLCSLQQLADYRAALITAAVTGKIAGLQ